MLSTTLTIRVSRREADRPRLLQATAYDTDGGPVAGLALIIAADDNGTLADDELAPSRVCLAHTPSDGIILFQWYEWPRGGRARDFTSTVTVSWEAKSAIVYLEDLFD